MSDLGKKLEEKKDEFEAKVAGEVAKVKRSLAKRMLTWIGWTVAALLVLVLVLFGAFAWYSKTNDFNRRVGKEVVKVLEDATGGKVELGKVSFDLWRLAV